MKSAAIIVTYNSEEHIERCIRSVLRFCPQAEVVVVDNGSTDSTLEKVRQFGNGVRLIENERNLGFGHANNVGMRAVGADLYMLLNADAWLISDVVTEVRACRAKGEEIDIAGPHLVFPDGSYQTSAFAFSSPLKWILQELGLRKTASGLARYRLGRGALSVLRAIPFARPFVNGLRAHGSADPEKSRESVDWVTGACMFISRKVLEATGGFDQKIFMYGEDEELCFRARSMGFAVERARAGPVVHCRNGEASKNDDQLSARVYESMKYVIEKNYAHRPVRRWMMHQILRARYRRLAQHLP